MSLWTPDSDHNFASCYCRWPLRPFCGPFGESDLESSAPSSSSVAVVYPPHPWHQSFPRCEYRRFHVVICPNFILQDRVHHHVTGCCHPDNVSFSDVHSRESNEQRRRDGTASPHEAMPHMVHVWSWFVFVSMRPQPSPAPTLFRCNTAVSPWETTRCISEHWPMKLAPNRFRRWRRVELLPVWEILF